MIVRSVDLLRNTTEREQSWRTNNNPSLITGKAKSDKANRRSIDNWQEFKKDNTMPEKMAPISSSYRENKPRSKLSRRDVEGRECKEPIEGTSPVLISVTGDSLEIEGRWNK